MVQDEILTRAKEQALASVQAAITQMNEEANQVRPQLGLESKAMAEKIMAAILKKNLSH
jgi:F0F1-type ATP synthase membrane subunit b/b'